MLIFIHINMPFYTKKNPPQDHLGRLVRPARFHTTNFPMRLKSKFWPDSKKCVAHPTLDILGNDKIE